MNTLTRLRDLGYRIWPDGEEIAYEWPGPGKPDPNKAVPLLAELKASKAEVLAQLGVELVKACFDGEIQEVSDQTKPARDEKTSTTWDEETGRAVEWFQMADLPAESFELWPWAKVSDPVKYRQFLEIDLRLGPSCPRARYGSLQRELRRLHELFGPRRP